MLCASCDCAKQDVFLMPNMGVYWFVRQICMFLIFILLVAYCAHEIKLNLSFLNELLKQKRALGRMYALVL